MQQNKKDDGLIKVEFANGSKSSEYDLVVACDGSTSRTRAMGFGGSDRDYINPINSWAAFFSPAQVLLKGSEVAQAYSAVGGRFIAIKSDPGGGSRVTLMGIHPRNKRDLTLPFREVVKQG